MKKIPYAERKEEICAILKERAEAGRTIYYGELGDLLGIPTRGPWKPVLDEISREERGSGRPDFTYLVISKTSDLPGQIEFEAAKPPSELQRQKAGEMLKKVFEYYRAK